MAHGFLVQSRGVEEMEDIGEKYFDDSPVSTSSSIKFQHA
jgi:hypothetical protein